MKVKLIPVTSYLVETEGGEVIGTFNKADEWQGFTRLTSLNGISAMKVLIVADEPSFGFVDVMLGQGKQSRLVDVVKASPEIVEILKKEQDTRCPPSN